MLFAVNDWVSVFQSTLPARGATVRFSAWCSFSVNFNPRSPHGERRKFFVFGGNGVTFQSTLPARGATFLVRLACGSSVPFQSTLPARGATHDFFKPLYSSRFQSTLPARGATVLGAVDVTTRKFQSTLPARGATRWDAKKYRYMRISIHAPRTGSDLRSAGRYPLLDLFQSTLPARGATTVTKALAPHGAFQSTLPARGATLSNGLTQQQLAISIHAPRTGSDPCARWGWAT